MKCKILNNFFHDEEDFSTTDFYIDLSCISGFYLIHGAIIIIIFGTEYAIKYEIEVYHSILSEFAQRDKYKLN
jgi:hypothetical protein